jgi:asparagine synthase (glutamine-hydrolysing)
MSAAAMARLGFAGDAKAKRLLSADGPREGGSLSVLQREVLQATLVAELTGIVANVDASSAIGSTRIWDEATSFGAMVATEVSIYLQATLLPDADAFSMASSVELRVPFVDSHVFAASLALAGATAKRPGKAVIGALLNDSYLRGLAARRKRGFTVPMQRWMKSSLAPVLRAAEEPDAPVWSVVDRQAAQRAGLVPLAAGDRWANTWVIAALNAWLETAI